MWGKKQEEIQKAYAFPSAEAANKYLQDLKSERDKVSCMIPTKEEVGCCCSPFSYHRSKYNNVKTNTKRRDRLNEEILEVSYLIRNTDFECRPSVAMIKNQIALLSKCAQEFRELLEKQTAKEYESDTLRRHYRRLVEDYDEEVKECTKNLLEQSAREGLVKLD